MKNGNAKTTVAARIDQSLRERLEKLAIKERRTLTQIIQFALEEYAQRQKP